MIASATVSASPSAAPTPGAGFRYEFCAPCVCGEDNRRSGGHRLHGDAGYPREVARPSIRQNHAPGPRELRLVFGAAERRGQQLDPGVRGERWVRTEDLAIGSDDLGVPLDDEARTALGELSREPGKDELDCLLEDVNAFLEPRRPEAAEYHLGRIERGRLGKAVRRDPRAREHLRPETRERLVLVR